MPLQNRVDPFGQIFADPARGLWMGNRGAIHDDDRRIRRPWQVRRWIICRLEFRGRHRDVMPPGRWTALFFLDEATAFSAGHRPCAECRNADHRRFRALWETVHPSDPAGVDAIDRRLHAERLVGRSGKRTEPGRLDDLPEGTFVAREGRPWLLWGGSLHAWSPAGYVERVPRPGGITVEVLTPRSVVEVFRAGYVPHVHPTAGVLQSDDNLPTP